VLILVRHGRTTLNALGLLQGHLDEELDEVGRAQAEAVAKVLGTPDRVISSPLVRARATAAALGLPVEVDERWIELDYGELDGLPLAELPASLWSAWRSDPGWVPPGGESLTALGARVRAGAEDLVADAADRDVVVVSHVSPIKAAVAWALGVGDEVAWRMWVGPASITRIGCAGPLPSLRSFNETAHLGGPTPP
jgi:broad specificity phosphatase PhoE